MPILAQKVKDYNAGGVSKEPGRMTRMIMKRVPGMAKIMRMIGMGMDAGNAGLVRAIYKTFGTCVANTLSAESGDSPIKNWSGIGMYDFPLSKSKKLSANRIHEYAQRKYGCAT